MLHQIRPLLARPTSCIRVLVKVLVVPVCSGFFLVQAWQPWIKAQVLGFLLFAYERLRWDPELLKWAWLVGAFGESTGGWEVSLSLPLYIFISLIRCHCVFRKGKKIGYKGEECVNIYLHWWIIRIYHIQR